MKRHSYLTDDSDDPERLDAECVSSAVLRPRIHDFVRAVVETMNIG